MATFTLFTKDVVLVKPSEPTPSTVLPLSSIDNRPFLNSLWHSVHVYEDSPNAQLDPALAIKEALSKALCYYYPLAGKLVRLANGKLGINCNADGVPFLEAIANCELSSLHYLDGTDRETAKHLVFDDFPSQYPLVVKVTKFLCGGFTLGIGVSHAVCDGFGASQFFQAIAELASGQSEPSVRPVWKRDTLTGSITKQPMQCPMDKATAAVSSFPPSTVLMHEGFKVGNESIRRLKMSLMKECGIENMKESFTSFECLAAYVWRSRARALKLSYDKITLLTIVVGIRGHLLDPTLPEGYYGNAIVDANVVLTVRELNEKPLSETVKLIRQSKKVAFTSDRIRNSINTLETKLEYLDIEALGASTILTDWRHLGLFEKVDFGWKEPVNTVPAPCNVFGSVGVCTFSAPSKLDPSMKGGVRIFQSLPSAAMPKFREEMEALRNIY